MKKYFFFFKRNSDYDSVGEMEFYMYIFVSEGAKQ